ncbi:MAG: NUDIX hydrolase [Gammaproteobacteria bacterium]|nr:NUDIX hydrolase [Gammaproteobacteria bacterium]
MKYCSHCSAVVRFVIPLGDNRPRHVCGSCEFIFYENPRIIAGCIPVFEDKILLCKRAIEPRLGYWTLPAGFMENGESTEQAALRETYEEAYAKPILGPLFSVCNVPRMNQVHLFYLAQMTVAEYGSGPESLAVELYDEAEIPWDDIAFGTVTQTLKRFLEDRKQGNLQLHHLDF